MPPDTITASVPRAGAPFDGDRPVAGGLVVGIAGSTSAPAEAYAAALGRPYREVPRLDPESVLAAGSESVFLVVPENELTFDVVERLLAESCARDIPAGVLPVPAQGADRLVRRVLRKATTDPGYATHSALYCDFVREFPTPDEAAFGSARSAEFLATLRGGVTATVIHGHGNGADFRVGEGVLCTRVGQEVLAPAPGDAGFLPCHAGGPCRLDHKTSFTGFHGAAAVRTRLLVLMSCAAFHPADGLLDPRFQLVTALLAGPDVATVVASTRINYSTPELAVAAVRSLRAGRPLGEIALRMNKVTKYGPPSFLCLGDPEARAPRTGAPAASTTPKAKARPVVRPQAVLFAADAAELAGLPELSERLRAGLNSPDVELLAEAALALPLGAGSPLCTTGAVAAGPECPVCGGPTERRTHESVLYRDYRRVTVHCAQDGVVADLPPGAPDVIRTSPTRLVVSDGTDVGGWAR